MTALKAKLTWKTLLRSALAFVIFLIAGNLAITAAWVWARSTTTVTPAPALRGVENLRVVDDHLWRGAAPTTRGYKALAKHGVKTIVDLRAEEDVEIDRQLMKSIGLKVARVPLRDGQAPGDEDVERFLKIAQRKGRVFVHCGAGVGRTGAMVAAYLVETGQADSMEALKFNLSVGPPSLEQIAFAAGLEEGDMDRPPAPITAVSRVLDAPRRTWVNVNNWIDLPDVELALPF